jgi:WD40 repeat protein
MHNIDSKINVWSLQDGSLVRQIDAHQAAVNAIHLHGNQLVSASGDCLIKLWDISTGQLIRTFTGHERGLACVQFDGDLVVSGSNDKSRHI